MAFQIGKDCKIDPSVVINVKHGFIGDGAIIQVGARIEGTRVEIGRGAYIDRHSMIGGGSAFDPGAQLIAGDFFHLGAQGEVNIARGVRAGHEVGCGIGTKIFTHGAFLDAFNMGAPAQWGSVEIGNEVWLPSASVHPGVKIGHSVVVAALSLVNRDLPSGCLAGGIPVKILKENWFPRRLTQAEQTDLIGEIVASAWARYKYEQNVKEVASPVVFDNPHLLSSEGGGRTVFNLKEKTIEGPATTWTLLLKDQLRRNGIRFRYKAAQGLFMPWQKSVCDI